MSEGPGSEYPGWSLKIAHAHAQVFSEHLSMNPCQGTPSIMPRQKPSGEVLEYYSNTILMHFFDNRFFEFLLAYLFWMTPHQQTYILVFLLTQKADIYSVILSLKFECRSPPLTQPMPRLLSFFLGSAPPYVPLNKLVVVAHGPNEKGFNCFLGDHSLSKTN